MMTVRIPAASVFEVSWGVGRRFEGLECFPHVSEPIGSISPRQWLCDSCGALIYTLNTPCRTGV